MTWSIYTLPAQSLSCVQLVTPWTIGHQASLSKGFQGKNTGAGCHFPPPGDLPNPGIKSTSPESPELAGSCFFFFYHWATWKAPQCVLFSRYLMCDWSDLAAAAAAAAMCEKEPFQINIIEYLFNIYLWTETLLLEQQQKSVFRNRFTWLILWLK